MCNSALKQKRFILALACFLLLLAVQTFSIELLSLPMSLTVLVTVLPVLPLLWAFFIFRAHFHSLDEYMQRLTGEAFLWVIGLLSFTAFIYGMLAMQISLPNINAAYILPAIFAGHGIVLQCLLWVNEYGE